ncbi:response regulator [Spirosoma sp. KCTC 42546]|uniref:response regulator n=1 Tax=Spirosoma sp. KCTC 42546 TaxID=2520506 RepID=UPI00115A1C4F|nr:response regulator [Spirosoma sp. KCTC 42546]QDK78643.1 response regulator [Spirosoma sp. KCTC 42546]
MKVNDTHSIIKANFRLAKVLIVEDNEDHWLLIKQAMQQVLPEVTPVRVATPGLALTLLNEWQYQEWEVPKLILLDLYLPESEDGWALLEQIKRMPSPLDQVRIVMLSSSEVPVDILKAYQLGISSYTVKPTNFPDWLTFFQELRAYWWETVSLPPTHYSF